MGSPKSIGILQLGTCAAVNKNVVGGSTVTNVVVVILKIPGSINQKIQASL